MLKDVDFYAVRQEITRDCTKEIKSSQEMKENLEKCKEIKNKLEGNRELALKADIFNAIVTMDQSDYIKKNEDVLRDNSFKKLPRDTAEKNQKDLWIRGEM